MKSWIKRLLSDISGEPSMRLHLSLFLAISLNFAIYYGASDTVIASIITGMATMAGLSVAELNKRKDL